MKYKITAPHKNYTREIAGVHFVNGIAETENGLAAQWFSGRDGFTVEFEKKPGAARGRKSESNAE